MAVVSVLLIIYLNLLVNSCLSFLSEPDDPQNPLIYSLNVCVINEIYTKVREVKLSP